MKKNLHKNGLLTLSVIILQQDMVAMNLRRVTQSEMLTEIRSGRNVIRVGATTRPIEQRMREYENENPSIYNSSRTVLYAETENVMRAEDQLLRVCREMGQCPENDQEASNMPEGVKGFVYMII
ncbi:hypothetical protein BaRGS_00025193 [Batillaria attramentaria]|uniref:Uncharacterized protein n=1 Tax=Batillaria attramentaria TaxID=370345 RepID=A0ABD0K8S5_9CAEN